MNRTKVKKLSLHSKLKLNPSSEIYVLMSVNLTTARLRALNPHIPIKVVSLNTYVYSLGQIHSFNSKTPAL